MQVNLDKLLVIQQVKKTAACTWPTVHYRFHKMAPFFATSLHLRTICLRQRFTNFQKNLWAALKLWATEGWHEATNQQISDTTVHNSVACVTWCLHSRSNTNFRLALPYRLGLELFRLSDSHTVCIFYFSHTGYILYPFPKDTRWKAQIKMFLLM